MKRDHILTTQKYTMIRYFYGTLRDHYEQITAINYKLLLNMHIIHMILYVWSYQSQIKYKIIAAKHVDRILTKVRIVNKET